MSENLSDVDGGPLDAKSSIFAYLEEGLIQNAHGDAVIVGFQPANHLSELVANSPDPNARNGHSISDQQPKDYLSWTYQELHLASVRFANALLGAGVQSRKSTAVSLLPNGVEYSLLLWTTILTTITTSNLDVGALHPSRRIQLESYLQSLSADIVLVPDAEGARTVDETISKLSLPQPKVKLIVPAPNADIEPRDGWQMFSKFILQGSSQYVKNDEALRRDAKSVEPSHPTLILFTSGTSSGQPKGCIRTNSSICHILTGQTWITPGGKNGRLLIAGANFRAMCYAFTLQTWYSGGATVMPSLAFDPQIALRAIQGHAIDSLTMVPYHFHSIIDHHDFKLTDVSSVRLVASGGDMITKDFLEKLVRSFPEAEVIRAGHGMTEGGALFSWPYGRDPAKYPYYGGIATLGKVSAGSRLRIIDEVTGLITKRGQPGELHVCSASFSESYLGGVRKEDWYMQDAMKWFKTGDLAMIASDGSIYILGRIKDIIKRAGVPITPAALENCLEQLTKSPCSVIAVPHPTLGAEPFAVVQSFDLVDEAQVKQRIIDEFGNDFALGGAASLEQLGLKEFPLNATAKIMKLELQEPVQQYLAKAKR